MLNKTQAWNPKMDLGQEGWLMFFKPYQLAILEATWASNEALNSRQCWERINKEKSRASVINFLISATDHGLLLKHEITGKGGHRGMYRPAYDKEGTKEYLKRMFKTRLDAL